MNQEVINRLQLLKILHDKHLKLVRQTTVQQASKIAYELNLMNVVEKEIGLFDELYEYIYLPSKMAIHLTT